LVAELICTSLDDMLRAGGVRDQEDLRRKARAVAGKFNGPKNLAEKHDGYFVETMDQ